MIELRIETWPDTPVFMVQTVDELPEIVGVDELFLDVETARVFDDNDNGGMYPWKGDRICGVAVTFDDDPRVWYIPVRHTGLGYANLPLEAFQAWLQRVISTCKKWINHNVVFDAIFAAFDGAVFTGDLIDTLTLCKVHDSDRFEHGLKVICRDWLDLPMSEELDVKAYLDGIKSKNYADVPADILGGYAGVDVLANRKLYRYLQEKRSPQVAGIWETESKLAAGLFDMEIEGLLTDIKELKYDRLRGMGKLIDYAGKIAEITGKEFTNSNPCMYDLLITQYNMPVLATKWEKHPETGRIYDTGRPSFDKKAMALYEIHPMVLGDAELKKLMKLIMGYRKESQHQSLFVVPFLHLMDDFFFIHPTYNPVVRTGRMSCSRPNIQQQNKRSKALIHPRPGYCFISCDYSQIEFRLIVHYIQDEDAIKAYNENPDTDFHQWVADMIGVKRKAAKQINFGMGYGAGKKKVEAELAANPDIIEDVSRKINQLIMDGTISRDDRNRLFHEMCRQRAAEAYQTYHETLPGVKRTSYEVARICGSRGFVFNAYGRQRHLPLKASHKAFNSLVQGCAMDIIKERMVFLFPRYNAWMRRHDIRIVANVHDEVLFEVPIELMMNQEVHKYLLDALQSPSKKFRVPITCGLGVSAKHWAEAAGDDTIRDEEGRAIAGKLYSGDDKPYCSWPVAQNLANPQLSLEEWEMSHPMEETQLEFAPTSNPVGAI